MEKTAKASEEWDDGLRKTVDSYSPLILDRQSIDAATKLLDRAKNGKMFFPAQCEVCDADCRKATHINVVRINNEVVNSKSCSDMHDEATTTVCTECLKNKPFKGMKIITCCLCGTSAAALSQDGLRHMNRVYLGDSKQKIFVCDSCESEHTQMFRQCKCCTNNELLFLKHRELQKIQLCLSCFDGDRTHAVEFLNSELLNN